MPEEEHGKLGERQGSPGSQMLQIRKFMESALVRKSKISFEESTSLQRNMMINIPHI